MGAFISVRELGVENAMAYQMTTSLLFPSQIWEQAMTWMKET
jgi:hypothetical protein